MASSICTQAMCMTHLNVVIADFGRLDADLVAKVGTDNITIQNHECVCTLCCLRLTFLLALSRPHAGMACHRSTMKDGQS